MILPDSTSPFSNSSSVFIQNSTSQKTTSLLLALDTAVFINLHPMSVWELVKRNGTSRESTLPSATLNSTVSHSLPWDPCTVITLSRNLRGSILLSNLTCPL